MSVIGVGTDIVEVSRIEQMKEAARERLAKRVLTPSELSIYANHGQPSRYLAKRWAAKEAASKALQTGIAKGVSFQHFEIINDDNGAPHIKLTEKALERASTMGATSWFISIADEQRYATATVILSK